MAERVVLTAAELHALQSGGTVHGHTAADVLKALVHKGAKSGDGPVAAGLAVRAADTGRVLMLQRAFDEDDPAGGFWELPGGRLEPDEDAFEAARREWSEETGCKPPAGDLTGLWNSGNGKYRGFVLTVPSEDAVDILGPRDAVENPDDPDGDLVEALAWFDPKQLRDNPSIRPELAGDQKRVRRALKSAGNAETLREYWTHEAHPGPTHWANEEAIEWGADGDWARCVAQLTAPTSAPKVPRGTAICGTMKRSATGPPSTRPWTGASDLSQAPPRRCPSPVPGSRRPEPV